MAAVQVSFSVPEFPVFRNNLDYSDQLRYKDYISQFKVYATTALSAQSKVAHACIENGGFQSQKLEIEALVGSMHKAVEAVAHTTSLYVADEVGHANKDVVDGLGKCMIAVESLRADVDKGLSGIVVLEEVGSVENGVGVSDNRGPNFERNRVNRIAQKLRKQKRQDMGEDWRVKSSRKSSVESVHVVDSRKVESKVNIDSRMVDGSVDGFWNSCSSDVRQELIDSKARMHIAENKRREKEAREKIESMDSPIAMVEKVMKMVNLTEEAAKKANDNRVAGWARTVAQTQAESFAKSAPVTVESFESFKSDSSVPIEIHNTVVEKMELLEKELSAFRQQGEIEKEKSDARFKEYMKMSAERLAEEKARKVPGPAFLDNQKKRSAFELQVAQLELTYRRAGPFDGIKFAESRERLWKKIFT